MKCRKTRPGTAREFCGSTFRHHFRVLLGVNRAEIAKLKVELRAAEKGWICSRTIEGARYDLVLDNGLRLFRVQVKYAGSKASNSNGSVQVSLRRWAGNGRDQRRGKTRTYSAEEIDSVAVYIPQIDKICWFESEHFAERHGFNVRYATPKNGQSKGVILAQNFVW